MADTGEAQEDSDNEHHMDRGFDMVARVRAAKEAAQRRMEEFGDVSEYIVATIHGRKKEPHEGGKQASLDFGAKVADEPKADKDQSCE